MSERLSYRPLSLNDIEVWTKFLANEENTRFFPKLDVTPAERSKMWIESQLERYTQGTYGMNAVCLKETNQLIGQCGILKQDVNGIAEIEIGYHFLSKYQGKGYATEAAVHMKNWAFKNNLAKSIISIIAEKNFPSQAVAKRNGMTVDFETTWKNKTVKIYRVLKLSINDKRDI